MQIGMLWFDNDPQLDLESKVRKAANYYKCKYRQVPNLCFVHPSMIPDMKTQTEEITVYSSSTILPHHFWIGFQQQDEPNAN